MTAREFFTSVIAAPVSDELKAYAESAIAKLDARNEKRANTLTKEQKANLAVMDSIATAIGAKTMVASEIATAVGISTQKASALCRQMVAEGRLTVGEVKVKGKGAVKTYTAVNG